MITVTPSSTVTHSPEMVGGINVATTVLAILVVLLVMVLALIAFVVFVGASVVISGQRKGLFNAQKLN